MTTAGSRSLHAALYAKLGELALDYYVGRAPRSVELPFGAIEEYDREDDPDLTDSKEAITARLLVFAKTATEAQTHVDALVDLFDPRDAAKLLDLSAYSLAHYGTRIPEAIVAYEEDPDQPYEPYFRGTVSIEFLIIET